MWSWKKDRHFAYFCLYNDWIACRLFQEGITCMIEPINNRITIPGYYLSDINKGMYNVIALPVIFQVFFLKHMWRVLQYIVLMYYRFGN